MALGFLIVAAVAWIMTVVRMSGMDDMSMGLGPLGPFVVAWTVMMAAMMFPSASPLMFEFARNAERRRGWRLATALLGMTYLGVWLAFGVVCYLIYNAFGMPWPNQAVVGGVALTFAGLYALTPLKRASEARCRELCALHGPLPFNLMRSALIAGGQYGLSCLGCSAALMAAMVLIGTSNLLCMIVITALVLIYKLAPPSTLRWASGMSAVVVVVGILFAALA